MGSGSIAQHLGGSKPDILSKVRVKTLLKAQSVNCNGLSQRVVRQKIIKSNVNRVGPHRDRGPGEGINRARLYEGKAILLREEM